MTLARLDPLFRSTREALRIVAVHVVARAERAETGRIGLRPTPGGLGTPDFGADRRRLRISGGMLVAEWGGSPTRARATTIDGSSLAELAAFAGVDLDDAEFSVGRDTPAVGDPAAVLSVDEPSALALADWYALTSHALDRVLAGLPVDPAEGFSGAPSLAQLWPEHFDIALDVAFDPSAPGERRVNLGGSPGDPGLGAASAEDGPGPDLGDPYLYVGPWTADRPGDPAMWNAPFGAVLPYAELAAATDPRAAAADFYHSALERLRP